MQWVAAARPGGLDENDFWPGFKDRYAFWLFVTAYFGKDQTNATNGLLAFPERPRGAADCSSLFWRSRVLL
jgi:hypothetical protein